MNFYVLFLIMSICVLCVAIALLILNNNRIDRDITKLENRYFDNESIMDELSDYNRVLEQYEYESGNVDDKSVNGYLLKNYTTNDVFNSVLSYKKDIAEKNGIRMTVKNLNESNIEWNMSDADTAALLSNILDNAIESASGCDNSYINVTIEEGEQVSLLVTNSSQTDNTLLADEKLMITSKEDKREHGFGVSVIREIADKYNGHAEFDKLDNEFRVCFELTKE